MPAQNVVINTTYVGALASPFVAPAILSADTIANGYISVLENVRYKAVLKKLSGGAITARSCEFLPPNSGELTLDDVTLTCDQLQVNEQVCNFELAQDWAAAQMKGADAGMPNAYAGFISQYVARITSADVEKNIWGGDYSYDGTVAAANTSFQGILQTYRTGTAQTHQTTTTDVWQGTDDTTAATFILTHLAALVADAPVAIAGDPDAKIFLSRKSANLYYQALAAKYNLPFLNDGMLARYAGYDIVVPAGMVDDCAILSKKDNLYFGTNVLTDMIEARILDLTAVTGDAVTRIALLFDAGTQIVDEASMAVVRMTAVTP